MFDGFEMEMASTKELCIFCVILLFNFAICNGSNDSNKRSDLAEDAVPKECIQLPEDSCPLQGSACPCTTILTPSGRNGSLLILCCHLKNATELLHGIECAFSGEERTISALHIRNSSLALNLALTNASRNFSSLTSLSVTGGTIKYENGHLSDLMPNLLCLNLSKNGIVKLPSEVLSDLSSLRALDLSANNVTQLPNLPNVTGGHQFWIDFSGNEHLQCRRVQEALSKKTTFQSHGNETISLPAYIVHNKLNSSCVSQPAAGYWFPWTYRINLKDIKLESGCPKEEGYLCNCTVYRLESRGSMVRVAVAVDCSGRGLSKLPEELPKGTVLLNVSNNSISSLEPLVKNHYYNELRKLYADNNSISSIDNLEGTDYLNNLEVLSIRSNRLSNVPIYFLSIDKYVTQIYLGDNPYHCDCNTFHKLKPWVELYKNSIIDHNDMICNGEELQITKIIDLQNNEVCKNRIGLAMMDPRFIAITVELLLIICLVGKLSYDCWVYKTTNRLTWPASAMPKVICCDWIIEL